MNINTKEYWDQRFSSGNWEKLDGRSQTEDFALEQIQYINLTREFCGTILDFGCGLGDAIPIYRKEFPRAKLIGLDLSESGIQICKARYGDIAEFIQGDYLSVPKVDVIIASNVFEHLSNDLEISRHLLAMCHDLYIAVPYKEYIIPNTEHINTYDECYFNKIKPCEWVVYNCKGWSQTGWYLFYNIYFKNIGRFILGKRIIKRNKQILFHFT